LIATAQLGKASPCNVGLTRSEGFDGGTTFTRTEARDEHEVANPDPQSRRDGGQHYPSS
jgi:hypothetical protein